MSAVEVIGELDANFAWDGERLTTTPTWRAGGADPARPARRGGDGRRPMARRRARYATRSGSTSSSGPPDATALLFAARPVAADRAGCGSSRSTAVPRGAVVDLGRRARAAVARSLVAVRQTEPARLAAGGDPRPARPLSGRARGPPSRRAGVRLHVRRARQLRHRAARRRALPRRDRGQLRPRPAPRGAESDDRRSRDPARRRPRAAAAGGDGDGRRAAGAARHRAARGHRLARLQRARRARERRAGARRSPTLRSGDGPPPLVFTGDLANEYLVDYHAETYRGETYYALPRLEPGALRSLLVRGLDTCHREVGVFQAWGQRLIQPYAVAVDPYMRAARGLPAPARPQGAAVRGSSAARSRIRDDAPEGARAGRRRNAEGGVLGGVRRPRHRRRGAAAPVRRAAPGRRRARAR